LNLFSRHLQWCGPFHLAFPGDMADASTTSNKKKKKKKKKTLHMLTHGAM
jgi:hypothetical protein